MFPAAHIPIAPWCSPRSCFVECESHTAESAVACCVASVTPPQTHVSRTTLPRSPEARCRPCCAGRGQDAGACLSSERSPGGGCAGPWNAGWGSGGLGCEGPCSWGPPSGWKTGAPGSGTPCGGLRPGLCPSRGWVMRLMVPMRTWSGLLEDGGRVGLQCPAVCAEKPELRLLLGWCGGHGGWGGVRD